jgi:hypothetical protein
VGPAAILVAGKVTWHKPTTKQITKQVNKINFFEALAANANGGMVTWLHLPPMPMAVW